MIIDEYNLSTPETHSALNKMIEIILLVYRKRHLPLVDGNIFSVSRKWANNPRSLLYARHVSSELSLNIFFINEVVDEIKKYFSNKC